MIHLALGTGELYTQTSIDPDCPDPHEQVAPFSVDDMFAPVIDPADPERKLHAKIAVEFVRAMGLTVMLRRERQARRPQLPL